MNFIGSIVICYPLGPKATKIYANLHDHQHFWHILRRLKDEFKSIWCYLLIVVLFLNLIMIKDLISDKTYLYTLLPEQTSSDVVLVDQETFKNIPLV